MIYEYKIETTSAKKGMFKNKPSETDEELLNKLGQEGWELVSVSPMHGTSVKSYGGSTVGYLYHLKRPLK